MSNEPRSKKWKQTQKTYGILLIGYIAMLDGITMQPFAQKRTVKVYAKQASTTAATVYHLIHKTQIHPDWEYLGVDKPMLRYMEKQWLTADDYHFRIGAYPSN